MNNYIQINGKKYMALAADWVPSRSTLSQVRPTWSGRMDVIYAPAVIVSYSGTLIVAKTPATGFGSMTDFRASYDAPSVSTFIDHYGTTYSIAFQGKMDEKSIMNTWDAASNEFHIPVTFFVVS